jgi:hypothetical protein
MIIFFSAACAEKLRETTTNAAMTPTALLLSCAMGLSSQAARWSLRSDFVFFGYPAQSQLSASGGIPNLQGPFLRQAIQLLRRPCFLVVKASFLAWLI